MKKYFNIIFVFFISIFVFRASTVAVSAHPLDVSYTDIHIKHDFNNNKLPDNIAVAEVYFPWVEAGILIQRSEHIASPEAKTLINYQKPYAQYLDKTLTIFNDKKKCYAIYALPPKQPENEILFGRGVMIPVRYECPSPLNIFTINNSIFIEQFPIQQNNVNIFNGPEVAVKGALLTAQSQDFTVNIAQLKQPPTTDTSLVGNSKLLDKLSQGFLDTHAQSLPKAIGLVFLLGLLHTLEAGHSKTVLTSFLIQKKAKIKHGLLFAAIFTITHIADIVILGIVLFITNSFIDVFTRLSFLQTFSLYALLFMSVYMLFKNIAHFLQHRLVKDDHHHHHDSERHHDHNHSHDIDIKDIKKQLFMGFIVGLSPCLFGWSIFMVILTTKKAWVIFPIILSFGFGIFVALSLLVLVVGKFKVRIFEKNQWLADFSPIISSILLVLFALSALV